MIPGFFNIRAVFSIAALAMFLNPTSVWASAGDGRAFCSKKVIQTYRPVIDLPQVNDKYKHCAMSCVITLRCGSAEAYAVGVLKEISDLFGKGTPDLKDLRANKKGILLVTRGYLDSPQECQIACRRLYPTIRY